MKNSWFGVVATASFAVMSLGSVPASAQQYNGGYSQGYAQGENPYAQQQTYQEDPGYGYQRPRNYGHRYAYRGRHHAYRRYANRNYSYDNGYRGQAYAQSYCHQRSGTTGTIVGAVGGGILGNVIARGTAGTLIGAGAGALLGRNVERKGMGEKC